MGNPNRRLGRRLNVKFRPIGEDTAHVGYSTNVSATGMFVATIRPLKPGTEVDIELSDKEHSIHLDAVVVHARKVPPNWQRLRPSGMGLRFLDPSERSLALRQLVGPTASLW